MTATVIPLSNWQDPQGDVVLIYSEHECSVFFGCWVGSGQPADYICHLSFQRVVATRSFAREFLPYSISKHPLTCSYILRVHSSDWLREHSQYRQHHYPLSSNEQLERSHFVVVGHDIYHEILAMDFTEATIPTSELIDERLLVLHRNS